MQKAEAQHNRMQSQPAVRQGKGMAFESPQGERIAQLEAMAESSPQMGKQAQLAAMANSSSQMSAQRKAISAMHNSPILTAQRQQLDSFAGVTAQRAQARAPLSVPIQLSGREGDEWDPGPGKGEQAPPTPRPGQGGQERPSSTELESSVQDGYSPRAGEDRDESAQLMKAGNVSQLKVAQCTDAPVKPNNTGLPDSLKSGIESLSGMSMDSVRVHYNSSQPAQLNALAYAQGTDIHVAPGQEQHLPHEAWHVVQQAQGRVKPTIQMKDGVPVNDDAGLEHEADVMGARALTVHADNASLQGTSFSASPMQLKSYVIQCDAYWRLDGNGNPLSSLATAAAPATPWKRRIGGSQNQSLHATSANAKSVAKQRLNLSDDESNHGFTVNGGAGPAAGSYTYYPNATLNLTKVLVNHNADPNASLVTNTGVTTAPANHWHAGVINGQVVTQATNNPIAIVYTLAANSAEHYFGQ